MLKLAVPLHMQHKYFEQVRTQRLHSWMSMSVCAGTLAPRCISITGSSLAHAGHQSAASPGLPSPHYSAAMSRPSVAALQAHHHIIRQRQAAASSQPRVPACATAGQAAVRPW